MGEEKTTNAQVSQFNKTDDNAGLNESFSTLNELCNIYRGIF
jgi:hypothetical protein